jgi:hypothetical protein
MWQRDRRSRALPSTPRQDAAALMARTARQNAEIEHAVRHDAEVIPDMPLSDAQLVSIAKALESHGVLYALIGGAGAQLHGAPMDRLTRDADILVEKTTENLARLAAALNDLDARLWISEQEPEGLEVDWSAGFLNAYEVVINTITTAGPLDVNYKPDGIEAGYAQIAKRIVPIRLQDVDIPVAALDDIVHSKEAAGRDKDITALAKIKQWMRRDR